MPLDAVLTEGLNSSSLWRTVIPTSGRASLGLRDDRYVEVREGLFPGDRIVVRGAV